MSDPQVSSTIQQFYEAYPYPTRGPGDSADPYLEYIRAFGTHNSAGPLSFLDAGCGTGYSTLGGSVLYPNFQVYGCDLNRVALKQLRDEADIIGLQNLHLREVDLLQMPQDFGPEGGFDIIFSCGVIHHTSDPVGVLTQLAGRLAPQGVLRLLVYGDLGRTGLYRFARATQKISGEAGDWKKKLENSRELMRELAEVESEHGQAPPPLRGFWEDANRADDAEFADRYLNPHDKPFTISTLKEAIETAGLKFLRWFDPTVWELPSLLPKGHEAGLFPKDQWDQFALVEELFDRPILDLYLTKPDFEARSVKVQEKTYLGLNPQLTLTCEKVRGLSLKHSARVRRQKAVDLGREEGRLLEAFGLRFISLGDILTEMPHQDLDFWIPLVQDLVDRELLFSPHVPPAPDWKQNLFGVH